MKQKIYVSPSANRKEGYGNRYIVLLKRELAGFYDVLDSENKPCLMQSGALLKYSFKADVFLLSFVETIAFQKLAFLQFLLAHLGLLVMRLRGRKIAYIFHNPRPHKGENFMSRSLTKTLLKRSCLVVSHSKDTAECAVDKIKSFGGDVSKVHYVCHPLVKPDKIAVPSAAKSGEVLIWGNILPYKGVLEFVSSPAVRAAGLKVRIVGRCDDALLASRIEAAVSREGSATSFIFENRSADFEELAGLVKASSAVLFPYLPGSVSGSGALMDTLTMGGSPAGPDVGAFSDLAAEGVCSVYRSEDEMIGILKHGAGVDLKALESFIDRNSWQSFATFLFEHI